MLLISLKIPKLSYMGIHVSQKLLLKAMMNQYFHYRQCPFPNTLFTSNLRINQTLSHRPYFPCSFIQNPRCAASSLRVPPCFWCCAKIRFSISHQTTSYELICCAKLKFALHLPSSFLRIWQERFLCLRSRFLI